MANLQASDSCLQTTWGTGQAKGSALAAHGARKNGGGSKSAGKRLLKRAAKNSVDLEDYEEEQDHLDACFKDSDYGEGPRCWEGLEGAGASTAGRTTLLERHPGGPRSWAPFNSELSRTHSKHLPCRSAAWWSVASAGVQPSQ